MEREQELDAFLQKYLPNLKPTALIDQSLTHRSYAFEHKMMVDNERLEFLGDSIIGFEVSSYLYLKYPESSEGELSKMKSKLVSRSMLGGRARDIGLSELVLLGKGEEKSGGRHRLSLVGSALEAFVGAIFLESEMDIVREFIRLFLIEPVATELDSEAFTDHKSRFQELIQKTQQKVPKYITIEECGPDHDKKFHVEVRINGTVYGEGWGSRKKLAENEAAKIALMNYDESSDETELEESDS